MKIKIVHIVQSPCGGVSEYLYYFLKNFKNNDYENYIIASDKYNEYIEKFKKYCKKIYIVPMKRQINIISDLTSIFKIKKILKEIKPNVAYLHSSKAGALGRIAMLFNFKIKILYNAHGWYFNADIKNKKKNFYATIERILALKTDKIINISKSEYDSALKYKIASDKKMCIIENGVDLLKFKNSDKYRTRIRKKYNIKNNEIIIGVVGRISEQKDPLTMIKAFNEIYQQRDDVKLMFVGSGELEETVKKYAKENNLLNVIIFTGWVNNVEKFIPAFDIAILPSKWEGFGLALIEYMACNKPIVASNVGGISNIITDKKNGLLFEKGNYKELANKIEILINNDELANKIIETNKSYRKQYDIKILINKHERLFQEEL